MPSVPLDPDFLRGILAEINAALAAGRTQHDVARDHGVPHSTIRRWFRAAKALQPLDEAEKVTPYKLGGSAADRKVIQLEDEVRRLRTELREAHRDSLDEEAVKNILGTISLAPANPPTWLGRMKAGSGASTPEVPMTMWADWHGGEVVSSSEVNGVNSYSVDIMRARVRRLVDRTIDLCHNHGPGNYPGVVINLIGDFVSGGLHPELAKTDELEILPSVLEVRDLLVWGLTRMADTFGSIYCPAVAGNHGRGTPKPEFKRYIFKNFDWLIYELLRRHFADDPRVIIDTRPANEVFYSVYGHRFLALHGDMLGVKGGDGIIGAIGPIMRGEIKTRGSAASSGMEYDTLLMGHWHQQLWLPRAIVSNCLKGYDEYAKNALRAPISAPTQPLWFVHPKFGITTKLDVRVEEPKPRADADWVAVFDPGAERKAA